MTSEDEWIIGEKNLVLKFNCAVLLNSTPLKNLPALRLRMSYKFMQADSALLSIILSSHGFVEASASSDDFNLLWTGNNVRPQLLFKLLPHQRVNHFPRSYEITRKDRLYQNIERMQRAKGKKNIDIVPQTFVLPLELDQLIASQYRHRGSWIVKPVASSRGRGIYIVHSVDDIPKQENVVVAKYIERPLLVDGCKCDLRLYVAVTCYNPLLIYLYEEGLVRMAAVKYEYTNDKMYNPCMHLCNYSVNKHHANYINNCDSNADDIGHKWSLAAFLKYLRRNGVDTSLLMDNIEDVVVKTILSSAESIVTACKLFVPNIHNCFELYGFDILIDEELKPWLIEVNLSPSLGCDTALDTRIKSSMLTDLLTLVGLPTVDPFAKQSCHPKKHRIRDLSLDRNIGSANATLRKKGGCSNLSKSSASVNQLSPEETRLIRAINEQFERRGGFVRIFPTSDTWRKYANYLDSVTGIPSFGESRQKSFVTYSTLNANKLVHYELFPKCHDKASAGKTQRSLPLVCQPDRLERYERSLEKGYPIAILPKQVDSKHEVNIADDGLSDEEIFALVKDGYFLNKSQLKIALWQYLLRLFRQLKEISENDVTQTIVDGITQFLRIASYFYSCSFSFKIAWSGLKLSDKLASARKYLSDFLHACDKDTFFIEMDYNAEVEKSRILPIENYAFDSFVEKCSVRSLNNLLDEHFNIVEKKTRPVNSTESDTYRLLISSWSKFSSANKKILF